jgi:LAO/AO transport system kinase
MSVSARTNNGIDKAWSHMFAFQTAMIDSGELMSKRSQQLRKWMWNNVKDRMLDQFLTDDDIQTAIRTYEQLVTRGLVTPFLAADAILALFSKAKIDKNL